MSEQNIHTTQPDQAALPRSTPSTQHDRITVGLWNPETHSFVGYRLHRAIIFRGWTVPEFARAAHVHPSTLYNALKGKMVRDSTAVRCFQVLATREPMSVALRG